MGSSKSLGYTAIGDAVNLTSRLEGATKEYGVSILTTEETLKQIVQSQKNLPSHRLLDSLKVKGKNKSVQIVQIFESEAPAELLSAFKNAMQNYSTQKWAEAIRGFENCNSFHRIAFSEEDKVSLIFIERCHEWQKEFPPADWDGSWKLTSK